MRRKAWLIICVTVGVIACAGTASALSVDPEGGPPGSSYEIAVSCDSEPSVYVLDLDAGQPPATMLPRTGAETAPGTWTFQVQAGDVDQSIGTHCGDRHETFRYDVDAPRLFPGPTYADFGAWRPDAVDTAVVGTDCPSGGTASVTITGPDGFSTTQHAPIDGYGNWQVDLPASTPTGDLDVRASCGGFTYDPIVMHHRGSTPTSAPTTETPSGASSTTTTSTVPEAGTTTGSGQSQAAATPVSGNPHYTG